MLFLAFMYVNDEDMRCHIPIQIEMINYITVRLLVYIVLATYASDPRVSFIFIFIFALHDCGFIFSQIQSFTINIVVSNTRRSQHFHCRGGVIYILDINFIDSGYF